MCSGQKRALPIVCPVDGAGKFQEEAGIFAGQYVRDANENVLAALGDHLLAQEKVVHRYGHCWRCKTPIIFRATSQWFLKASEMRDLMLSRSRESHVVSGMGWQCTVLRLDQGGTRLVHLPPALLGYPDPGLGLPEVRHYRVIGTIRELEEASGKPLPDPHRPFVDEVTIPCHLRRRDETGRRHLRCLVRFRRRLMGNARVPGQNRRLRETLAGRFHHRRTGPDAGWFYSQLGASTIAFGKAPYKSVCMHGFALDAEGKKMSKSLGNVVTPEEVIAKVGVDVLRLYVLSSSAPWDDLKFNWEGVGTINRAVKHPLERVPVPDAVHDPR